MNAPFFFVHGDDAAARFERGSEMDVAHLGEGVAHGVIDRAFADLATFDVSDRNAQGKRDGSGREHFVAIGNQEKNVRAHLAEAIGQAERSHANGLGHADVGIGTKQTLELRGDGKAVFFDFADGVAELGRKVRAEDDEFEIRRQDAQKDREAASKDGCSRRGKW